MLGTNQVQAGVGFWKLVWRYWYVVFSFIILLPTIISIFTSPGDGLIHFSQKLLTADNLINKDVNLLKTNPESIIGMATPKGGDYNYFRYFCLIMYNVVWEILTNLWMLFFPMVVIYWIIGLFNHQIIMKNIAISFGVFLLYLLIANAILLFLDSSLAVPESLSYFGKFKFVFINILPFHGIFNLFLYLVSFLR